MYSCFTYENSVLSIAMLVYQGVLVMMTFISSLLLYYFTLNVVLFGPIIAADLNDGFQDIRKRMISPELAAIEPILV